MGKLELGVLGDGIPRPGLWAKPGWGLCGRSYASPPGRSRWPESGLTSLSDSGGARGWEHSGLRQEERGHSQGSVSAGEENACSQTW